MEKISLNPEGDYSNDRATIVLRATFQEYETNQHTSCDHAFDYTSNASVSPYQRTIRVNPSERKLLDLGELNGKIVYMVLSHDIPRVAKEGTSALQEAMKSNRISITNADGVLLAIIRPRIAIAVEYPFPVYVQSDTATTLLTVTAFPV